MAEEQKRTVSDELQQGIFHPDLPRIPFKELLDKETLIEDATIIKDFSSDWGTHDLALLRVKLNDKSTTTASSSSVVVKKISELITKQSFPLYGKLIKRKSASGREYFDII